SQVSAMSLPLRINATPPRRKTPKGAREDPRPLRAKNAGLLGGLLLGRSGLGRSVGGSLVGFVGLDGGRGHRDGDQQQLGVVDERRTAGQLDLAGGDVRALLQTLYRDLEVLGDVGGLDLETDGRGIL